MGGTSGSKAKGRRDKDKVDLKPRGTGSGAGGANSSSSSLSVCPTAFEVSLPEASSLPHGTRLTLRQSGAVWIITANGKELASLRKDRSEMLTLCLEKGYRYEGVLRTKGERRYGEFKRT